MAALSEAPPGAWSAARQTWLEAGGLAVRRRAVHAIKLAGAALTLVGVALAQFTSRRQTLAREALAPVD